MGVLVTALIPALNPPLAGAHGSDPDGLRELARHNRLHFGPGDDLVAFARDNRQAVRGHLRRHIFDVVRHHRGKIDAAANLLDENFGNKPAYEEVLAILDQGRG